MAVVIETTIGDITVDLFVEERPQTCKNFLKLCKIKYYNFCLFHSVQANFIAQTGDPTGLGTGGESVYGLVYGEESRYYEAEKLPKIKHNKPGLLSMVNYGNSMLGSQFFVTLGTELKSLEEHCVFAEVTEGHDILIKLNDAICDNQHRPYQDIRITHTVILEDPFDDLPGLVVPDASPDISSIETSNGRIGADEKINDEEGLSEAQLQEIKAEREAKARATILEIVGDLPHAEVAPPENVLFVCKLNPVTTDEDLELIFGRYGKVKSCEVIRDHQTGDSLQYAFVEFEDQKSCEQAYLKMDNVLIDDRRIHVDFSQSVSKYKWRGKGLGVQYLGDKADEKDNNSSRSTDRHSNSNKREYYKERERDRGERDRSDRTDRRRDDDRRRRGADRGDDDHRRRERRKDELPRRREEESWRGDDDRWDDDRKRRDVREERRRDDDRKYDRSNRRDDRRREDDRRRDVEKRRNGTDKKESSSRRTENQVEDKKSEAVKNKDEKSPKRDTKHETSKHNNIKQEVKHKERDVPSVSNVPTKHKEEIILNNSENKTEPEDSKLPSNLDVVTQAENSMDTITSEKNNVPLKEKKKKKRKKSSSSDSSSSDSSDSSSSSSSLDLKKKHRRKLTVAKKYYHRGELVKVIKKKKNDSSDSESSDESSDSDHRKKRRKYKVVKVIKKRRRTTTDDSDSESSSSEDSDSSRPRKKKKKTDKKIKKKKKDRKRNKKKRKEELTDSSTSEEVDKYKKKAKT